MSARPLVAGVLGLLALPAAAAAHAPRAVPQSAVAASVSEPCGGRAMVPDKVITGKFGSERQGSYVMVPFEVPAGADKPDAIRVKYCYDKPELTATVPSTPSHTLDLGLYEPRRPGSTLWGLPEFRGWGGSSHPDVTLSPEGFSTEQQYTAKPRVEPVDKTTRAFLPGSIPAGMWAAELGVAAVTPTPGDETGEVEWRVEIDFMSDDDFPSGPKFTDEPYVPTRYDDAPTREGPGWYAGDLHVHGEHSAYGDASMSEVFDYAFGRLDDPDPAKRGAGLDFITLSDYVSGSSWGEVGRFQAKYPDNLIIRSAEVITYEGHLNNHNTARTVDYRAGPIYERAGGGELSLLRGPRPPRNVFEEIRSAGGFTQINHPTIFPSSVPAFSSLCRGCPWDYSQAETDYSKVDGIEVATGPSGLKAPLAPGPNPFTVTAIQFYEDSLALGEKIAAVGVSDSHNAGRTPSEGGLGVTQAPIGEATTVVFADELSSDAIQRGVEAGHTYVKVGGNRRPDLRFEASAPGPRAHAGPAIMGDTVSSDDEVTFKASVLGAGSATDPGGAFQLLVLKNGAPFRAFPVVGDEFTTSFPSDGPGRYRLQLQRGQTIEGVTSPIYVEPARSGGGGGGQPSGPGTGGGGNGGGQGGRRAPSAGTGLDAVAGAAGVGADEGGGLPFTGWQLTGLLSLGAVLLAGGVALRRRAP